MKYSKIAKLLFIYIVFWECIEHSVCCSGYASTNKVTLKRINGHTYSYSSIQRAIDKAEAGDTIFIDNGTFFECLQLKNKHGKKDSPITIQGKDKINCIIDGSVRQNAVLNLNQWEKDQLNGRTCLSVGHELNCSSPAAWLSSGKRLWVYGNPQQFAKSEITPGIYYDKNERKIYIRLDKDDSIIDEKLYIGDKNYTLFIKDCSNLILRNLTVQFGGTSTLMITGSSHILLSDIEVLGGRHGVYVNDKSSNQETCSNHIKIDNCRIVNKRENDWLWTDFKNKPPRYMEGAGIFIHSAGPENSIQHSTIEGSFDGISVKTIKAGRNSRVKILGNKIHDIFDDAIELDTACPHCHVFDNQIFDVFTGISLTQAVGPIHIYRNQVVVDKQVEFNRKPQVKKTHGVVLKVGGSIQTPTQKIFIYNNSFLAQSHINAFVYLDKAVRQIMFYNNIFFTDHGYIIYHSEWPLREIVFKNNLYHRRQKGPIVKSMKPQSSNKNLKQIDDKGKSTFFNSLSYKWAEDGIQADPKFIDPLGKPPNLNLSKNSPAINAGVDISKLHLPDSVHIHDNLYDIGAIEYTFEKDNK